MEILEELSLRRAMQISLLNCVTPNLRQVNVVQFEKKLVLRFYYNSIKEEEEELPNEVESEMWGFYYGRKEIESDIIISAFPAHIPHEGLCVYCRAKEEAQPFYKTFNNFENEINTQLLVSQATQISLLGYVTPNLRKILLEAKEGKILLHFYYHNMTAEEKTFPELIANKVQSFLKKTQIEISISILPFPNALPIGSAIYARYETH